MEILRSATLKELKHLDSHLHSADEEHQSALSKKSDQILKECTERMNFLQENLDNLRRSTDGKLQAQDSNIIRKFEESTKELNYVMADNERK